MTAVSDFVLGLLAGGGLTWLGFKQEFLSRESFGLGNKRSGLTAAPLLRKHFRPAGPEDLNISERIFPHRLRADLHSSLEELLQQEFTVSSFYGVSLEYGYEGPRLADCLIDRDRNPTNIIPPSYEELDIGEANPLRVLKGGLWLLTHGDLKCALLLSEHNRYGESLGSKLEFAVLNSAEGIEVATKFFTELEQTVMKAHTYRGKILSLEQGERAYSGQAMGVRVHKLREVSRDQVILPAETLELLERNVIEFIKNRDQLADSGMSTRKGILFYGPPGTGKTHTIHHLASSLPGHTTLLITAEQIGLLTEYMALARLLQPSIVVLEDVDLIARDRREFSRSACEESLLNRLLNEMDGLKEDSEILFLLTTNYPEMLEAALAARPGRIDQAIEFPLPDAVGREKLLRLYAGRLEVTDYISKEIVKRTEGVSASFIKELMRRMAQFSIQLGTNGVITPQQIDLALDEMLFKGGELNRTLLGGGQERRS